MRGKSIFAIAMLFCIALTSIGFAADIEPDATKVLIEPSLVKANIDDKFWIDVNIEKVTGLYAFQFKIDYESGTKVIGCIAAEEGGFLTGPMGTGFAWTYDPIKGLVNVGCTIQGAYPGISGSGTLARIRFVVAEAGESDLHLFDVVLQTWSDGPGSEIIDLPTPQTRDGYYDGPNAELVRINIGARPKHVGENATFEAKVVNEDTQSAPLYVRARFDNVRQEDGMAVTMYGGQTYSFPPVRPPEYLNVDGFDYTAEGWTEVGTAPWLDAEEDGNYIEGTTYCSMHAYFTFEDIALEGAIVDYVEIQAYTDGPYDEGIDYDVYDQDWNWLGSMYATGSPGWVTPRWVGPDKASDLAPALLTEEGLNAFQVLVHFYDPAAHGGPGNIVDAMRLYVVFKAGRAPEEPYVDSFDYTLEEWTEVGTAPWLDAEEDGNYIEGTTDAAWQCWFGFEDVDIGADIIDYVQLWGYTDGPLDEAVDFDIYDSSFNWAGSLYATGEPAWVTPRWVTGPTSEQDGLDYLLTEEGINDFEILVYFYDPAAHGGPGNIVDAIKLEIVFKADRLCLPQDPPLTVIQPGQVVELELATWPLEPEDVGTYACTVTVQYSFKGKFFNEGKKKVITEHWTCSE